MSPASRVEAHWRDFSCAGGKSNLRKGMARRSGYVLKMRQRPIVGENFGVNLP
jgi:hypothetical protein